MTSGTALARDVSARAIERVARESYGKLLAWIAWQWRDIAAAEDALSVALSKALETWPQTGVPQAPESWLLTVAKRELLQLARRARLHQSPEVLAVLEGEQAQDSPHFTFPDTRLKLLFVCAHPAIEASVRPALMMQTVLGLEAKEIAQAMLVSPSAMAQRLVRAKQKIRDTALRFEEPEGEDLAERLQAVLEAIYAVYGLAWDGIDGAESSRMSELRDEALFLASLLCDLLMKQDLGGLMAEPLGLLSLMLLCSARQAARRSATGEFVSLSEQDMRLWDKEMIFQGDQCLAPAALLEQPGPFQLEAAIQAAHIARFNLGKTPWPQIVLLYDQLLTLAPSTGAEIARAVALAEAGRLVEASDSLSELAPSVIVSHQPYWVALSHVQQALGEIALARSSLERAIGLTSSATVKRYLQGKVS